MKVGFKSELWKRSYVVSCGDVSDDNDDGGGRWAQIEVGVVVKEAEQWCSVVTICGHMSLTMWEDSHSRFGSRECR